MKAISAIEILEGKGSNEEQAAIAMQSLINSGTCWQLQRSYGHLAMDSICSGYNMLGREGHHDFWGNYVPSRTEVKPGTKGSREFVAANYGEAWAVTMESVE